MKRLASLASLALLAAACAAACAADVELYLDPEDRAEPRAGGKSDAWDRFNDPVFVDETFLYNVHQLPLAGESPAPSAGHDWPSARDAANARWDGPDSLSPIEKYALAADEDLEVAHEMVSYAYGAEQITITGRACRADAECGPSEACATAYDGRTHGCVALSRGLRHGRTAYALAEPRARAWVRRRAFDGSFVSFYPSDLEALMAVIYQDARVTRIPRLFALDAGAWHVLVANRLGLRRQAVGVDLPSAVDRLAWRYRVLNAVDDGLREVTAAEAAALSGRDDLQAHRFFDVELEVTHLFEAPPGREAARGEDHSAALRTRYLLETDADGAILGGVWLDEAHPEAVWWPDGLPKYNLAALDEGFVKTMVDEAALADDEHDARLLLDDVTLAHRVGSRSTYAAVVVKPGSRRVDLTFWASRGSARLLVGPKDRPPRLGARDNLCDDQLPVIASHTCSFPVDAKGGVYYVRLRSLVPGTVASLLADVIF